MKHIFILYLISIIGCPGIHPEGNPKDINPNRCSCPALLILISLPIRNTIDHKSSAPTMAQTNSQSIRTTNLALGANSQRSQL